MEDGDTEKITLVATYNICIGLYQVYFNAGI